MRVPDFLFNALKYLISLINEPLYALIVPDMRLDLSTYTLKELFSSISLSQACLGNRKNIETE